MLNFDPFEAFFAPGAFGGARTTAYLPPADIAVSEKDLVLTFDMPGLTSDDVEIELAGDTLTVRGERKRPEIAEGTRLAHVERSFGPFERTVRLPAGIDTSGVTASMDNGVLSLLVPKPARMMPKTITIGTPSEQKELTTA